MAKKQVKAVPRASRLKPRVFSRNFPKGFDNTNEMCFTTLSHYRELERKYYKLFKRYQRENGRFK